MTPSTISTLGDVRESLRASVLYEALKEALRLLDSYGDPGDDVEFISIRERARQALSLASPDQPQRDTHG